MFVIEKITVYDIEEFAKMIARNIPDVEPDFYGFEECGDWNNKEEFDFQVECEGIYITVIGTVNAYGTITKVANATYLNPPEYRDRKYMEIEDIEFFVDGLGVEISNEYEVIKKINKLL